MISTPLEKSGFDNLSIILDDNKTIAWQYIYIYIYIQTYITEDRERVFWMLKIFCSERERGNNLNGKKVWT